MKQALQALIAEMEYVLSCINEDKIPFDGDDFHEALRLGKESLAQPEQEPVGEAYLCDRCHTPLDGAFQCPSCGHGTAIKEPVYTTPPQRKQLTDDEAFKLIEQDYQMEEYAQAALQLIRRAEAAHGIKE